MQNHTTESGPNGTDVLDSWTARKAQPIVVLYVVGVFIAFIALAHFVLHSPAGVKALLVALVGAMGAAAQPVIDKIEYRLTGSGIEKRAVKKKKGGQFTSVVRWDELDRVVPVKRGFKYYKHMDETNTFRKFWNLNLSDRYSGEIHVERDDLDRILEIVADRSTTKTRGST